jgi:thiol-disulfide isomerase/thioredoxin
LCRPIGQHNFIFTANIPPPGRLMKKTLFILCTLWGGLQIAYAQKSITLKGEIKNPVNNKVIIANLTATRLEAKQNMQELILAPDGTFTVTLPATEDYNWIAFLNGNLRADFVAAKGANLSVKADAGNWQNSIQYTGKGKEVAEFFAQYPRDRGNLFEYSKNTQELSIREPGQYKKTIDSLMADEYVYLDTKKANLPKDFYIYWKDYIRYMNHFSLLTYPLQHESIKKNTKNIQSVPKESYVVAKMAPAAFDDKYLSLGTYQSYVENYFPAMLNAAGYLNILRVNQANGTEDRSTALQQTDSVLQLLYKTVPEKTAELIAAKAIFNGSQGWTVEEMGQRIEAYNRRFPKSPNNEILRAAFKEIKKFNPGEPALDFNFTSLDGKAMKLSDLKGKVVYMDFWASWCGPCKGEMPYAKQLKEYFKDNKDVVFLYVSIDEKEDAWKRGITAMDISGIHARTPGWTGEISALYKINSVPSYFLIDKKGNFVLKKTPRPSQSEELKKEIEKLL